MASASSAATASATASATVSPSAQASTPSTTVNSDPAPAELPISDAFAVERIFTEPVSFFITGEEGRLALLATGPQGELVPYRLDKGKSAWEKLALPANQATPISQFFGGIYFGRDNRPRLMGYRTTANNESKMVYLRFKDGAWHDQRKEIGSLASDKAALFGVLGEADPEVVCKAGGSCLLKSRKGWKEIAATIAQDAVVRVFEGHGYAVTTSGFYRAEDNGFIALGGKPPWTTSPTGFWVSAKEDIVVVEPDKALIHELEAGATEWATSQSPIPGPRDIVQSGTSRFVVGDTGIVHHDGDHYSRLVSPKTETPLGPLTRVIRLKTDLFVIGSSGAWLIRSR